MTEKKDVNRNKKKPEYDETYIQYPTGKPDELTLNTRDGREVTVSAADLPPTNSNLAVAGATSENTIKARLRMMAEQKLEESGEKQESQ